MIGLLPLAAVAAVWLLALLLGDQAWSAGAIGPICSALGHSTQDWTFDLWITGPLFGSGLLYLGGIATLWSRAGLGRDALMRQAALFITGWLALAAALVSPLHHFGGQLFALHMIEHEVVMAAAAPLLVLGRPAAAFPWAMPRSLRHAVGRVMQASAVSMLWAALTRPLSATLLHGIAIWAWHVPVLFDAAVVNVPLHRLQHVSFLLTAILFWWAVLRRCNRGAATAHLFITMIHTGLLGALMTLAPHVLYRIQTAHSPDWGLTPLEDQQLAGLVMWIPAGTIYAGAALACAALWIRRSGSTAWSQDYALRHP